MTAAAKQVKEVFEGRGLQRVGALVFWTLEGVDVEREAFKSELSALGLEKALGRPPTKNAHLGYAVKTTLARRKGVFARRLARDWALVVEREADGKAEYDHVATATVANDRLEFEFPEDDQGEALRAAGQGTLISRIRDAYYHHETHLDTSDLSAALVALMQGSYRDPLLAAVSLRERTGGLYFVPSQHVDKAISVSELVKRYAPSSTLNVFTITGEADNLVQAATAAKRGFVGQLNELREECAAFRDELKNGGRVASERNLATRSKRFSALHDRVSMFRDVLGGITDELRTEIETSRQLVLDELEAIGT